MNNTYIQTAQDIPDFLKDYNSLAQHVRAQLDGLSSRDKGKYFADFVQMLVPQTDIGLEYSALILTKKESYDDGIDFKAQRKDRENYLLGQAKLWIDRADTIDNIVSKFQASMTGSEQRPGFEQLHLGFEEQKSSFVIVTLSQLDGVIKQYKRKNYASRSYFDLLEAEGRITFVDGQEMLSVLRAAYRKLHEVPSDIQLNLETEVINKGNVYFGIVSSQELKRLYDQFGDALFFENIRDFLGQGTKKEGRSSVNDEIIKTVTGEPERMLERNNGIVFRASKVECGSPRNQLLLGEGSVINGCQTTMCLIEHAKQTCFVSVKVVETQKSWDVAKSANFQNPVDVIDLDLARNLRPQLAKRAATLHGMQIDDGRRESAFQIIDRIYQHKVTYLETRLLYIGLFSKTPSNVFASNYTELMPDLIRRFYEGDPLGENVLGILFSVQEAALEGLHKAQEVFQNESYAQIFERLYSDDSLAYRCLITILALCGLVNLDISDRKSDGLVEYNRTKSFLSAVQSTLSIHRDKFLRYYRHAVKIWMQETLAEAEDTTRQNLHTRSKRLHFSTMYKKLCMEADADDELRLN